MSDTFDVAAATRWLERFDALVDAHTEELTRLDSEIGDADHGANLQRGMRAVRAGLADPDSLSALFQGVGMTLVSSVGGASGPLYGTLFLRIGRALGDAGSVDAATLGAGLRAGLDGVVARGKAAPGDKTLVDALTPAIDAWDAAGDDLTAAARAAAAAAAEGRDATRDLVARKGRASYLGERSADHIDPGAASTALLFEALADAVGGDA